MYFEDIFGNNHVKEFLKRSINKNILPNTLLFSGPEGVGKRLFAKKLAMQLMYNDIDALAKKRIDNENHSDLHIFYPESKNALHSMASMRLFMNDVFKAPFEAKSKIFIIDDAERMLLSSSNAILKTLEEPTLDSYIILITTKIEDILPTILSRCCKFKFKLLSESEIITLLKRWGKSQIEAKKIAFLANGSVKRAYDLINNNSADEKKVLLLNILTSVDYINFSDAVMKLEKYYDSEFSDSLSWHKDVDYLFSHILMWYRDLHILKLQKDISLYYYDHFLLLKKQDLGSIPTLERVHVAIDEAKKGLERNIKLKNCLEYFFLKINHI